MYPTSGTQVITSKWTEIDLPNTLYLKQESIRYLQLISTF